MPLSRDQIVSALVAALQPLDFVKAAWEAGAASFGRVDEWSDLDLVVVADDERADDVWPVLEAAIHSLGHVEGRWDVANPPLGLRSQRFYWLREAGPYLLLDIDVFAMSTPDKLLDPEMHGTPVVHFDRANVAQPRPDPKKRNAEIRKRLETLRVTVPMLQSLVLKEINRGNDIEAVAFYHAWAVRPLVELLRIKHCPQRYQFHTRYVQYDLPIDVVSQLRPFFFVRDLPELARRREEAERWATALLTELPPPA